ncbi:MAG: deoxyhypusine synthase [Planctomycetes bacterium]|jgi:deoxyhypusine synthase|nr:deoxyhypusine synthase [Planctomycetota bacterium]
MTTTQTITPPATAFATGTGAIRSFMERHYTNFNSREVLAAAKAYEAHLEAGGKMMVTLSGAMSTAGIGRTLARLIREDKCHAITCTGANLEEDIFLLMAGKEYEWCPQWRALSSADEQALYERGMNRVTDTCIPEDVMRHVEQRLYDLYDAAAKNGTRRFPYEYYWDVLRQGDLAEHFQMPAEDSWMLAAMEKDLPIFTPGWEDSTQGNMFTAWAMRRGIENHGEVMKLGTEAMVKLAHWYRDQTAPMKTNDQLPGVGFFQIGGGIAGDFPICAVPMMIQDLGWDQTPFWGYFCQTCDAPTSYGGYSGAVPNEKITWGKLTPDTPKFMIQSDATIVAPLIFSYVLGD